MNKLKTMLMYLGFVEDNMCFPLLGNIQKIADSPEGVRYHLEAMVKEKILEKNEQKNLLPGKNFLWYLENEGILDQWLQSKAGLLFMSVCGSGKFIGTTVQGLIVAADDEKATIAWADTERKNSVLTKKQLKRIWPVRRGENIYVTTFEAKLQGVSKHV